MSKERDRFYPNLTEADPKVSEAIRLLYDGLYTVESGAEEFDAELARTKLLLRRIAARFGLVEEGEVPAAPVLPRPINLTATGHEARIELSWRYPIPESLLSYLDGFNVYFSTSTIPLFNPNINDVPSGVSLLRFGRLTQGGIVGGGGSVDPNLHTASIPVETADIHYFRVSARNVSDLESPLSEEVNTSATITEGLTDNLIDPECILTLSGRMRVLAQALVVQHNARVKDAQIELYFGDTPGDPVALGTQQVGAMVTTTARSFRHEVSVATTYGPGDYWARARLRNVSDVATAWASSALLTVLASDTTDTQVVPVADVIVAVRVASDPQSGMPWFLFGIEGQAQYDSAEASQVAYSYDWRPGDTFSQGADDPMPGKTHRIFDLPGRAVWSEPARTGRSYWTGRIKNAFGWSLWIPPFEVVVTGDPGTFQPWDLDVPELTHFGAWTAANPPPSGTVPGPGQVRFTYTLGSNAATAFSFEVQAYETLPTETVLLSGPTQTATAEINTFELSISGYTATLNQFQGNWLRIGKETGSNATGGLGTLQGAGLQELKIASNTAGDPFTVTVAGSHQIKAHGVLEHWSIVANLSRLIAYEHWAWPIAHGENPAGTYRIHDGDFMVHVDFTKDLRFRAHVHGYWGRSPWRYSDNTAAGTLTSGSAILKAVGRVTASSLDGEARSQHGVFLETWESGLGAWTLGTLVGTASIREAAGVTGGKVMRMTGRNSLVYKSHIPYDPSKQYRVRYRVRQVSDPAAGNKLNYLGNETANASKVDIGQVYTANGVSLTAVGVDGAWTEYTSWIKGHGTVVHGATNPLSPSPATTGTSYLRPSMRIGWASNDNTDGVFECDYVAIDVFDEEEIKRTYSGINTDGTIANNKVIAASIADGAVAARTLTKQAQAFSSTVDFAATAHNAVGWSAGNVKTADAVTVAVNSGNTGAMGDDGVRFIFFNGTATLQVSATYDAFLASEANILLCLARRSGVSGQMAMSIPAIGTMGITGVNISENAITAVKIAADSIIAGKIATNAVTAGTVAAGALDAFLITGATIRTSAADPRTELTSTYGLTTYAGSGTVLLNIPTSISSPRLRVAASDTEASRGEIQFGTYLTPSDPGSTFTTRAKLFSYATGFGLSVLPGGHELGILSLGDNDTAWESISGRCKTQMFLKAESTTARSTYLSGLSHGSDNGRTGSFVTLGATHDSSSNALVELFSNSSLPSVILMTNGAARIKVELATITVGHLTTYDRVHGFYLYARDEVLIRSRYDAETRWTHLSMPAASGTQDRTIQMYARYGTRECGIGLIAKSTHTEAGMNAERITFYSGGTPVAKQTVTGSRGANAALESLCTALANLNLITNSTT